jgi:hypothetical protein
MKSILVATPAATKITNSQDFFGNRLFLFRSDFKRYIIDMNNSARKPTSIPLRVQKVKGNRKYTDAAQTLERKTTRLSCEVPAIMAFETRAKSVIKMTPVIDIASEAPEPLSPRKCRKAM